MPNLIEIGEVLLEMKRAHGARGGESTYWIGREGRIGMCWI